MFQRQFVLWGALLCLGLTSSASASGFRCWDNSGFRVRLYNHVDPELGTRNPAVFILSTSQQGTVLTRENDEIRKSTKRNVVRYTVDGNGDIEASEVILQIRFIEGKETLEEGETVPAQLILLQGEDRTVVPLTCARYLKHD